MKRMLKKELLKLSKRFRGVKIDFYVFMPNHIHIIFFFENAKVSLPRVVQAYKSLTTRLAKDTGFEKQRFWQRNYYEHIIRSEEALNRIREYIMNNPEQERIEFTKEGRVINVRVKQA